MDTEDSEWKELEKIHSSQCLQIIPERGFQRNLRVFHL